MGVRIPPASLVEHTLLPWIYSRQPGGMYVRQARTDGTAWALRGPEEPEFRRSNRRLSTSAARSPKHRVRPPNHGCREACGKTSRPAPKRGRRPAPRRKNLGHLAATSPIV